VTLFVLDASVATKWLLPSAGEPLAAEALDLLRGYSIGEVQLIVLDLFWAELANVLWKAIRLGRCTTKSAETGLKSLRQLNLPTASSAELVEPALALAVAFDRTVYECLYVALAVQSRGQFLTADERLANALAGRLPVKWLGAA
jgi:predicted nucleic acid-binding protein